MTVPTPVTVASDAAMPSSSELQPWLGRAIDMARDLGASAAEATISVARGLSVSVRMGDVESVQFQRDRDLSVTVYFAQRTGSATTGDLSETGLRRAIEAACAIAKMSGEDPCAGLADADRMATDFPDLDLNHPWQISAEAAVDLAKECEAAAFAADPRVVQSEGASVDTRQTLGLYANTHGFLAERIATDHSFTCVAIAGTGENMQNGYWYTTHRAPGDMDRPEAVGRRAGERAVARLGSREITTRDAPVLFPAEVARGLFGHFIGAISGGALYRRSSFLLDKLGEPVFAERVSAHQRPRLLRGAASSAYDHEGVATLDRTLIHKGVLGGYLLASYSARKLGLASTGNAGGVFNLAVESTFDGGLLALAREMGEGLIVSEVMGQGVNTVTGDYSRGASGFWVENGVIAYPVQNITIAGRLQEMFKGISAIGSDVDVRGGIRCGSVLIDRMTIAGQAG